MLKKENKKKEIWGKKIDIAQRVEFAGTVIGDWGDCPSRAPRGRGDAGRPEVRRPFDAAAIETVNPR